MKKYYNRIALNLESFMNCSGKESNYYLIEESLCRLLGDNDFDKRQKWTPESYLELCKHFEFEPVIVALAMLYPAENYNHVDLWQSLPQNLRKDRNFVIDILKNCGSLYQTIVSSDKEHTNDFELLLTSVSNKDYGRKFCNHTDSYPWSGPEENLKYAYGTSLSKELLDPTEGVVLHCKLIEANPECYNYTAWKMCDNDVVTTYALKRGGKLKNVSLQTPPEIYEKYLKLALENSFPYNLESVPDLFKSYVGAPFQPTIDTYLNFMNDKQEEIKKRKTWQKTLFSFNHCDLNAAIIFIRDKKAIPDEMLLDPFFREKLKEHLKSLSLPIFAIGTPPDNHTWESYIKYFEDTIDNAINERLQETPTSTQQKSK